MIAASWNEIQPKTLWLSWRKIFPLEDDDDDNNQKSPVCAPTVEEFQSLFEVLGQELDESEVGEWLQADVGDRGYEHLSDAEIIVEVTSELTQDISDETDSATEPLGDSSCASVSISHGEAVKMFDSCITWLQLQEEASPHNLSVLRDIRDIAAKKS